MNTFKNYIVAIICLVLLAKGQDLYSSPENSEYSLKEKRRFKSLKAAPFKKKEEVSFLTEGLYQTPDQEVEEIRNAIEARFQKIKDENRFVDFLDEHALIDLPIGLKADVGALTYVIMIDSLVMTPEETFLFASMSFEAPNLGKIHFRGTNIKFSRTGGLVEGGKMELVGDYSFGQTGDNSQFIIKGSEQKTFVEFDCNGFQQMSLQASLAFSRNLMQPVDSKGEIIPDENVMLDFITTLTDWNNLLIQANLPSFQVKGLKGVVFDIQEAVLDYSDVQNAPSMAFPQGYSAISPYLQSGDQTLWRGVFIKSLTVTLPPQFVSKNKDGTKNYNRASFSGSNMLIDDLGFSGLVQGHKLIPIEKGKIGNWDFSLDNFKVNFVANSMVEAGFSGFVDIPINSKKKEPGVEQTTQASDSVAQQSKNSNLFSYAALIKPDNEYVFTVSNANELQFDLWKAARVTLDKASYVEIALVGGEFLPKAYLNGKMAIIAGLDSEDGSPNEDKSKNIDIPEVTFQGLQIQTIKPYVTVEAFSLGGISSSFGGFSLKVDKIEGGQKGDNMFLEVEITMALTGSGGGAYGATGGFKFLSEAVEAGDDLSYKFKRVELTKFGVDIDQGSFKFKGVLNFFREDPIYGNGISGVVFAQFGGFVKLEASAIFGKVNGTRYWLADALVDLGNNVPIFSGVFLHKFGGGASYHMSLDSEGVGSPLGRTASGIVYVPNPTVGLGLKAMVGVKAGNEKLFNADVTFEMAFNTGGGLKYINFRGNAYLLSTMDDPGLGQLSEQAQELANASKLTNFINENSDIAANILGPADSKGAQIFAQLVIHFDFDNKSLFSSLSMTMDVAGAIKGGGLSVMYFSPDEWYIYIGRPEYENRIYLDIFGIARFDSYFVMGSVIPDSPPPPPEVSEILGGMDLNYMEELNALADGAGIGFGASFRVDTGNVSFLMFYGRFRAGIGFDVMLKDYGDARCVGRGELGIDGWYANGQAYGYFDGVIGIKVELFFMTKKIEILRIGVASIIQAKLPNPVWMNAVVGGYFSVLGGMVSGSCRFQIEIGSECEVEQSTSSVLEGVEVIAQMTPQNGINDVDVFTMPQAVFNYEMEKSYHAEGYNKKVTFRIALEKFEVTSAYGKVDAELVWNDDKTIAVLRSYDILPSETDLQVDVSVTFEELDGTWHVVKDEEGNEMRKSETITFRTGLAPDHIPQSNIAYSYPSHNMLNFYKKEHNKGYIKLIRGQSYLFDQPDFTPVIRYKSGEIILERPLVYSQSQREAVFDFPSELISDQVYQLNFVNVPQLQTTIEANVSSSEQSINQGGVEMTVSTRSATGSVKNQEEMEFYLSFFRTSKYDTFRDKVAGVNPSSGWRKPIEPRVHLIGANFGGAEPFSMEEIYGLDGSQPLIRIQADLIDNLWFEKDIEPLIYAVYPFGLNRNTDLLGKVPVRAVSLYQYPYTYALDDQQINSGMVSFSSSVGRIDYELAYIMNKDLMDLQWQAARSGLSTSKINRLLTASFPTIRGGDYWVDLHYKLPGKETSSTVVRHKITNPID